MFNQFNVVSEFNQFGPHSGRRLSELLAHQTPDLSRFLGMVCGPPKTGNSTLAASLGLAPGCITVSSSHFVSAESVVSEMRRLDAYPDAAVEEVKVTLRDANALQGFLKAAGFFHGFEMLRPQAFAETKIPLVCGVRNPVDLMFSNLFYYHRNATEAELEDALHRAVHCDLDGWLQSQDRWFTKDLLGFTGWDALDCDFDTAKGYVIRETSSFRILVIRTERLQDAGPSALGELLKRPRVEIQNRNRAIDRPRYALYRAVRKALPLSDDLVEKLLSLRVVNRFFGVEELVGTDSWAASFGA